MVLEGQRVVPTRAQDAGFKFKYTQVGWGWRCRGCLTLQIALPPQWAALAAGSLAAAAVAAQLSVQPVRIHAV